MITVLLDTHIWAWTMSEEHRLTDAVLAAIGEATTIYVSPVSFFEISQKVRLGKWPQMAKWADRLQEKRNEQGAVEVPLTSAMTLLAGRLDWSHRDPFDRMLAATAILTGSTLISADIAFDTLPLRRVW